ncbi:phenylacetaldehyde oxime monooxygenase CYP71AN24-like isoform X2 [Gastrolobium bilobum]|uniref:phenylacetaldehyde oxime monooxygenase CYP71AN24-like isoform X2 n=1 Tax=Gastrolobium bilobum TaxID=150636 RepID=UPI002AAF48D5|nr:phenylacetaldehyde oxime monooxygenase CYP71AN24-like isoform X2 [Gastrolobium bilobum]
MALVSSVLMQLPSEPKSILFFSILCFISVIMFMLKLKRKNNYNLPPSPPKLPIIGNLHQLGTLPHRSLQTLSKKYGPLMLLQLGQTKTLVVSSADMAREITKTHDVAFSNRPESTVAKIFLHGYEDIGFAPYGEEWRQKKKICVLELLSQKRVGSFHSIRQEEITELVDTIRDACASKRSSVNLREMLFAASNNIVSRCVLGQKYDTPDGTTSIGVLARKTMKLLAAFSVGDFFPSLGWIDVLTGLISEIKSTSAALDAFFDEDMYVAGSDTTSTNLEWAFAELVKNPNTMKKVQQEVRRVVGKKSKVDENDVNQMNYLKCVIKETLRLHPPVPLLIPRETISSVKLKGYDIPPKTRVFMNAWAIQRDPELWDNPEEFLPKRFEGNQVDVKGQDFQLIPFGIGRRGCPGISFGLASTENILANLLYWFDWKLPKTGVLMQDLDMSEVNGLTVSKKIPLHLEPILYSFGSKP